METFLGRSTPKAGEGPQSQGERDDLLPGRRQCVQVVHGARLGGPGQAHDGHDLIDKDGKSPFLKGKTWKNMEKTFLKLVEN